MTSVLVQFQNPLPVVTWEKLPADFLLPDEPVESTLQPLFAAALRESLELLQRADRLAAQLKVLGIETE
ncbi:MAG: hypothetical protein MH252_12385 [Thermosynechococcaceae cyanobacterium MS004]|nr:hypothetical protein [Thermosynechococcaceae cyanobacterium MS004]